jgi:hypothetical protein
MRPLLTVLLGLCLTATPTLADRQEAREYRADVTRMLACVEAAEKTELQTNVVTTRQCVGKETELCLLTTDDTYQSNERMFCASAEADA